MSGGLQERGQALTLKCDHRAIKESSTNKKGFHFKKILYSRSRDPIPSILNPYTRNWKKKILEGCQFKDY